MSTAEIMAELPKLPPKEVESIYFRAAALLDTSSLKETPELLAALDEAEASYRAEGSVSADEMRRMVASWNTSK
ncbi:MAG: hypothetical protein PHD76_12405 [Methylacidiphilales bacterium]|nr:hypothetical protein [Candidatus Methylacidiphilales bacterium]